MEINESIFENLPERDILSLKCERAFLVGINEPREDINDSQYHLGELYNLVDTMGITPVESTMVKLRTKNPSINIRSATIEKPNNFHLCPIAISLLALNASIGFIP